MDSPLLEQRPCPSCPGAIAGANLHRQCIECLGSDHTAANLGPLTVCSACRLIPWLSRHQRLAQFEDCYVSPVEDPEVVEMEVHKEGVPFVFAISADRAGPLVGRGTTTATPRRLMFPATARKTLNLHIARRKFRMLTIKQLLGLVLPGDWFTTIDLKDAYFHVEIAPKHRKYLRFAFQGVAYEYNRLPFGYSLSPHTFSKCVATALQPLRARGMRVFFYLDELIVMARSREQAMFCTAQLILHLTKLGFAINWKKSTPIPHQ